MRNIRVFAVGILVIAFLPLFLVWMLGDTILYFWKERDS